MGAPGAGMLNMIPAAAFVGVEIGKRLAYRFKKTESLENILFNELDIAMSADRGKRLESGNRRLSMSLYDSMRRTGQTEADALRKSAIKRDLDLLVTGDDKVREFAIGKLFHQKGVTGARALRDSVTGNYDAMYAAEESRMRAANVNPDQINREEIEKRNPVLYAMRQIAEHIDRQLAAIETARSEGRTKEIPVTVNVKLHGVNDPAARLDSASAGTTTDAAPKSAGASAAPRPAQQAPVIAASHMRGR